MAKKLKKSLLSPGGLLISSFKATVLCATISLSLSGCGFEPLYAEKSRTANLATSLSGQLSHIRIAPSDDRTTQLLRNELVKKFNPSAAALWHLTLTTSTTISDLAIEADSRVTRANYLVDAHFELTNIKTQKTLAKGRSFASASYNKVASEFANETAAQNARLRGVKIIADDILLKIAIALKTKQKTKAHAPQSP